MSADRELLELAARAAGVKGTYQHWEDSRGSISCGIAPDGSPGRMWWNPLTDDGDALRLAVKLKLDLKFRDGCNYAMQSGPKIGAVDGAAEKCHRRAIVRAAAEIGRATTQTESEQP